MHIPHCPQGRWVTRPCQSVQPLLVQIVISQTRYEAQDRGGWQCVIRDENSNQETFSVPRKRSLEKKGDGRQQQ